MMTIATPLHDTDESCRESPLPTQGVTLANVAQCSDGVA